MTDPEEDEDVTCMTCNGSGEGSYDGSTCHACKGSGVFTEPSDDFYEPDEDDYDPIYDSDYYDGT